MYVDDGISAVLPPDEWFWVCQTADTVKHLYFAAFSPFLLRSRQFFILTNNTKVMDIEDYSNGCLSVEFRHLVKPYSHSQIVCTPILLSLLDSWETSLDSIFGFRYSFSQSLRCQ